MKRSMPNLTPAGNKDRYHLFQTAVKTQKANPKQLGTGQNSQGPMPSSQTLVPGNPNVASAAG